jgi:hypothetical protein
VVERQLPAAALFALAHFAVREQQLLQPRSRDRTRLGPCRRSQCGNPRALIHKYNVPYPYLIAGAPDQLLAEPEPV